MGDKTTPGAAEVVVAVPNTVGAVIDAVAAPVPAALFVEPNPPAILTAQDVVVTLPVMVNVASCA
jgi:hypothetical protein